MILPWRKKNDAGPDEWYFERHHVCGIVPFSLDTFAVQVSASALHMITNFLNFQERKDQWMPRCTLALQCWLRDLHANNLQYCSFISRQTRLWASSSTIRGSSLVPTWRVCLACWLHTLGCQPLKGEFSTWSSGSRASLGSPFRDPDCLFQCERCHDCHDRMWRLTRSREIWSLSWRQIHSWFFALQYLSWIHPVRGHYLHVLFISISHVSNSDWQDADAQKMFLVVAVNYSKTQSLEFNYETATSWQISSFSPSLF